MQTTTCTKCGADKPTTTEFFPPRAAKANGLASWCRDCTRSHDRTRQKPYVKSAKTLRREQLTAEGKQECTKCGNVKSLDEFPVEPRMRSGHGSWCNSCVRSRASRKQAKRRNDPVERMKLLAEKIRYARSPKGREQKRLSSQISNHKRRQRAFSLPWRWTLADWEKCKAAWKNKCAYCGKKAVNLTQEHFIPIVHPDCPGTVPENMLPACLSCNCSKGGIHPTELPISETRMEQILQYLTSIRAG